MRETASRFKEISMLIDSVPPKHRRLGLRDSFSFACHKDLACFNMCCRNKHLPLSPYDVLRLKRALKLHSDTFLVEYAAYALDSRSGFPIISLKMREDEEKTCPFVSALGCGVYENRPTACRLFPLGRASGSAKNRESREQFFFLQDLPVCLGGGEGKTWVVEEWLKGQGLLPYMAINDKMLDLLFHPNREVGNPLDDQQLQKLIVACYNLDEFRDFVEKTNLLTSSGLDEETRSRIRQEDTALLMFGMAYLTATLFP
jgi:Fe-S-cluster containining protein